MRIAVLVKQVPKSDSVELDTAGRLRRDKVPSEMNPWCRRALAVGVKLAKEGIRSVGYITEPADITEPAGESEGYCVAFTMGPPAAEAVAREAVACGADEAVLITDPLLAGSDTLMTAKVLARVLQDYAPFDLILTGKASTDSDTGQVAPELAQLLGLPFLPAAREIVFRNGTAWAKCETDEGWLEATLGLPGVIACAERISSPARIPEGMTLDMVDSERIRLVDVGRLGPGVWGEAGSPTAVGEVRVTDIRRRCVLLNGTPEEQAAAAVRHLEEDGLLRRIGGASAATGNAGTAEGNDAAEHGEAAEEGTTSGDGREQRGTGVAVLLEPGRDYINFELLQSAVKLADDLGAGRVIALSGEQADNPEAGGQSMGKTAGIDRLVEVAGAEAPEDMAVAVTGWLEGEKIGVLLAPSTTYGREVAARIGAATSSGVVGDAIGAEVSDGRVLAMKPVLGGSLVAEISIDSPLQIVTVRPGALRVGSGINGPSGAAGEREEYSETGETGRMVLDAGHGRLSIEKIAVTPRSRVAIHKQVREVDISTVLSADTLVCVGAGVDPAFYQMLDPLLDVLGAQVVATRKVTDMGYLSRALQVGITGINVSPDLYLAIGVQGKTNHMVGVRGARTVVSMNIDPEAPIFAQSDIGMVGDWKELVPALCNALRVRLAELR